MPDAHVLNWESTVATAPSPAVSGTSLSVAAGTGASLPTLPYNLIVCPAGADPLISSANFECIRVTARTTDSLDTIARAQESSSARTILVGDRIFSAPTPKSFTDIEGSGWYQSFGQGQQFNPADATTYYMGGDGLASAQWTTTEANSRNVVLQTGSIIYGTYQCFNNGTAGTGESVGVYVRYNNTTDFTIITTATTNSGNVLSYGGGGTAVAVVQGNPINAKNIAPTWATNPTSVGWRTMAMFQR